MLHKPLIWLDFDVRLSFLKINMLQKYYFRYFQLSFENDTSFETK